MDKLKVRDFKEEDVHKILEIHQANKEFFEDFPVTEEFILNVSRRDDFKFLVADFRGSVIGFLGILFQPKVRRAELGPIGIRAEYRQRNVGKKLTTQSIELLRGFQIRRVTVKVKQQNTSGIKFFESRGFSQEGYFKDYTRKREDVVQLVKFL